MNRRQFSILLGALAASCGGGSSEPRSLAIFGDSLSAGGGLATKPADRMRAALPGVLVLDYSAPSMRAFEASALVAAHGKASVAAILFGGSDMIGETPPETFRAALRELCLTAQSLGARVVLATIPAHPAYLARIGPMNEAIRSVAQELRCAVADVFALPAGELQADGVHLAQAWSDARTDCILREVGL